MRKGLFILFMLFCACIYHSCEYELKDVFQRETIKDPSAPSAYSVNLDLQSDTIYVFSTDIFMYDFSSNNEIWSVRFTLDNAEQYKGKSSCNSFRFINGPLTEGFHTLVAELYVRSGTNSIADIVHAEAYLMSKTWILKVDKSYYSQTHSQPFNGYLMISWPRYMSSDFVDYEVYRRIGGSSTLIKKQINTAFIDSSYVGESGQYLVKVNRKDNSQLDWGEVNLPKEIPKAGVVVRDDNKYFFSWTKSKYYNAVDTFIVFKDLFYSYVKVVKSTQNPNDTSLSISSSTFGESVNFTLKLVPKKGNIQYQPSLCCIYYSDNSWEFVGYPFKPSVNYNIDGIQQVNNSDFVYVQNDDTIMRYSTTSRHVIERKSAKLCTGWSYGLNIQVSPLRKYISSYHPCSNSLLSINSANFNEFTIHDISSIAPYGYNPVMSDNNIVATTAPGKISIYDLTHRTLSGTYTSSSTGPVCYSISSGGDYLFLRDDSSRLVKFLNPGFKKIWANPDSYYNMPEYFEFHALNPAQVAYWNGNTFFIKACSDFSTVYEFPLTDLRLLNIDYFNSRILCYNEGHFLVRSILNGDILYDVPIDNYSFFNISDFLLINNVIIHRKGVMYFLN
jgi:hypothetical protein